MKHTTKDLVSKVISGDRIALAKAITIIESTLPADQLQARQLLESLPGNRIARNLAITGPPGVGKSTFIESYGKYLIDNGCKVAVLAVDPSSQSNRGSIMGDKTRMETLGRSPQAFIRPTPSRGLLGGIAQASYEVSLLCAAAGYDTILIETVGVGQSETDANQLADLLLVLVQPAAGDELQGMKKGIIEIADLLIVNKWDGDLRSQADQTRSAYLSSWKKTEEQIILSSSTEQLGFAKIDHQVKLLLSQRDLNLRKRERAAFWFKERIKYRIIETAFRENRELISGLENSILQEGMHYTAAIEKAIATIWPPKA
ncbi:UNVERIFIED_CONTAM: hypothetical protein GTU68_008348 [Idotea baltica]|nr:hypothetical protein [Idotea baltica]